MKKYEIRQLLNDCISPSKLCSVQMKYDHHNEYYYPIKVSERLFLGAREEDFILNGYCIHRIKDIEKAKVLGSKYLEINAAEGLPDKFTAPDVDITDWRSVFCDLDKANRNIIIEIEDTDPDYCEFAIGRIVKVLKDRVRIKVFDSEGVWEAEPWEMLFSEITTVTFGSRYVDIFSKYVPDYEEQKG